MSAQGPAMTEGNAPPENNAEGWIVREVSFATFKHEQEISAEKLTQSLAILEQGTDHWNRYRQRHPRFKPYLRNVDLSWTNEHLPDDFEGIDLSGAELTGADFTGRSLDGANFENA